VFRKFRKNEKTMACGVEPNIRISKGGCMVRGKSSVTLGEVKGLLHEDRDFLKKLSHEVIQVFS